MELEILIVIVSVIGIVIVCNWMEVVIKVVVINVIIVKRFLGNVLIVLLILIGY